MIGRIVLEHGDRSQRPEPHPSGDAATFEMALAL